MARRTIEDESWDDEPDEDWEADDLGLDGAAEDADDGEPTIPCPYCRREIHEDAPRCPYCGQYISREDTPPARKPWLIVVGTIVTLYILYRWVFG